MSAPVTRFAVLGLRDMRPTATPPEGGSTADLLAWTMMPSYSTDPVEGLIDGVRIDLEDLAEQHEHCHSAFSDALVSAIRRLHVAVIFLRRADGREPMPPEYDPDAATVDSAPEATRNAAPAPEEKPS